MLSFFRSGKRGDIGIDLGTANTLVYARDRGVVVNEPSVVAVSETPTGKTQVLAVGEEARQMVGRTPAKIRAIRPMRSGVIGDFDAVEQMIAYFIRRLSGRRFARPAVAISVPHGATPVERRAVIDAGLAGGARDVALVDEPMAAAVGAGLPVNEPRGSMVIDFGGGTTEAAVTSLGGIVCGINCEVGGFDLDAAVAAYIKRAYNVAVGEYTAEAIKLQIGAAIPPSSGEERTMEVKGLDLMEGIPRAVQVRESEIAECLAEPVWRIVKGVHDVLEQVPPELAADIVESGIVLTGGGALLRRMDQLLREETGLAVTVAEDPLLTGVHGVGRMLDRFDSIRAASA
jgi:rod shape-determining protein MreB